MRTATTADAEALGLVHVRSWQAAYRGLVPQEYLDGLDPSVTAQRWREVLGAEPPTRVTAVLDDSAAGVVGFVSIGASRDPDTDSGRVGEVFALYLLPTHWRMGGGRLLMDDAVARLTRAGFREATLWVLGTDQRARRFYEAVGWQADGTHKVDESLGFPLAQVRYRRDLTVTR